MSIVPLKKVSVCGLAREKDWLIERIQTYGGMHLVPLRPAQRELEQVPTGRADDAYKALRYLTDYPDRRRQVRDAEDFDLDATVDLVLANRQGLRETTDRRDFLVKRIRDLQPWGDFAFPPEDELAGQKLWFYTVPHKDMDQLRQSELVWQIVHRDNRHCHVAMIAEDEPASSALPVARTHTGARPRSDLQRELERVEIEIEEIVAKREELTKWIQLISANLTQAEDQAARELAAAEALDDTDLFAVQGWLRADDVGLAQNFAAEHELAMMVEDPGPEDKPPTLMANRPGLSSGEDLVEFYQTPGYREWDPSTIVFFSFALFFAMIMADAGYGLILTAVVAYYWKRMGESATGLRMRKLAAALAGATIGYGILTGGYFGVSPPEGSLLGFFHILDLNDINAQMKLSITIGVLHIVLANAIKSHHAVGLSGRLQPLAWSCGAIGGLLMYLGAGSSFWFGLGVVLLVVGLVAVAVFASDRAVASAKDGVLRVVDGLMALAGVGGMFGDILSYMRLFALGLAGSSLALTINNLAGQVTDALPGVGLLIGILIILLGHVINLSLCLMSAVVHGLRLNVIEFFKWGLSEEGYPFRAFVKKELSQ